MRMHSTGYAVATSHKMSVRLSVRLSHASILSKRLHISSNFFHQSSFSIPNRMAIFQRWPVQRRYRMQVAYEKIAIFDQYLALSRKWCKGP